VLELREALLNGQLLAPVGIRRGRQLLRIYFRKVDRVLEEEGKLLRVLTLLRRGVGPLQALEDGLKLVLLRRVHAPAKPQRAHHAARSPARPSTQMSVCPLRRAQAQVGVRTTTCPRVRGPAQGKAQLRTRGR